VSDRCDVETFDFAAREDVADLIRVGNHVQYQIVDDCFRRTAVVAFIALTVLMDNVLPKIWKMKKKTVGFHQL
jgi:hypothetical protein